MKNKNIVLVCALALGSAQAFALQPTDLANLVKMPYETQSTLGTKLRVYKDLAYATRDDQADEGKGYVARGRGDGRHRSGTYFDIYAADSLFATADARAKTPVFVFMHGGSWSQAYDKDVACHELLRRIAAKGYFVLSMNYQLQNDSVEAGAQTKREKATFADMLDDVDAMVTYLKKGLPAVGLPTDKIVLGGESAGGHLAMCYAWDQDAPGISGLKLRHDLRISCVTSVVGPSDLSEGQLAQILFSGFGKMIPIPQLQGLAKLMCWLTDADLLNMEGDAARAIVKKWAPVTLVKPASCPAILAYACDGPTVTPMSSDMIVPVSNYTVLTNSLTTAGVSYDAKLFMNTKHWEVASNGADWISDRLVALKENGFKAAKAPAAKTPAAKADKTPAAKEPAAKPAAAKKTPAGKSAKPATSSRRR